MISKERDFEVQNVPTEDSLSSLILLADEESLKRKNGGVLQIARRNFFSCLKDKKKIIETELSVLIDSNGYAQPLMLRMSAESTLTGVKTTAKLLERTETVPLLVCTDYFTEQEFSLFESEFTAPIL